MGSGLCNYDCLPFKNVLDAFQQPSCPFSQPSRVFSFILITLLILEHNILTSFTTAQHFLAYPTNGSGSALRGSSQNGGE